MLLILTACTHHHLKPHTQQGDYHRYLAEFKTGADRKEAAEHTLLAYKAAQVGRAGDQAIGSRGMEASGRQTLGLSCWKMPWTVSEFDRVQRSFQ